MAQGLSLPTPTGPSSRRRSHAPCLWSHGRPIRKYVSCGAARQAAAPSPSFLRHPRAGALYKRPCSRYHVAMAGGSLEREQNSYPRSSPPRTVSVAIGAAKVHPPNRKGGVWRRATPTAAPSLWHQEVKKNTVSDELTPRQPLHLGIRRCRRAQSLTAAGGSSLPRLWLWPPERRPYHPRPDTLPASALSDICYALCFFHRAPSRAAQCRPHTSWGGHFRGTPRRLWHV